MTSITINIFDWQCTCGNKTLTIYAHVTHNYNHMYKTWYMLISSKHSLPLTTLYAPSLTIFFKMLGENLMIVWCVGSYILHKLGGLSTTWERSLSHGGTVGLLRSGVWLHAPHQFGFHLCRSFNNFWAFNLNWSFIWFWKSIPHGEKDTT